MLYFLVFKVKNNRDLLNKILVCQVIVIIISMLWMPISIKYLQNKNEYLKYLIIFIVFIVGIAALGNAINIYKLDIPSKNSSIGRCWLFIFPNICNGFPILDI